MDTLRMPSACSARFRLQKAEQALGIPRESNARGPHKIDKNRVERPLFGSKTPKALILLGFWDNLENCLGEV